MCPLRVLVVEDNPADIDLLQECLDLEDSKVNVDFVHDGLEAMSYLRQNLESKPHVVILDLNLPGLSGCDVLGRIRADSEFRHTPVVILTHSDAQSDILKTYALGANCYITKPCTLQGFRHVVRQLEDFWFCLVKLPTLSPSPR
jgi:chemotaxis family two-component system response regulator Rcp1